MVVLVRARNPSNIGAVARAMHDLGYADLRVVNAFPVPFEAAKSAVDASSVVAAATCPGSLAEAIADCTFVFGTTAVGDRALEHPLHTLAEAVPLIAGHLAASSSGKVALLFGSEKTGLSNDELSHCHALLTIPMNPVSGGRHLSMNLGQAVAICLYTLAQSGLEPAPPVDPDPQASPEPRASGADLERLFGLLSDVLESSGYVRRHPANSRAPILRRLVRRMALAPGDAEVWHGVLRQTLFALTTRPHFAADESPADESKL